MKERHLRILLFVCLCVVAVGTAAAQTGKITGTVTDATTGEPMPGVNVFIEGTTRGTATGADGDYVVIGVRPGVYTVAASFIGYTTQLKEGVRVSVDLTTEIDFELEERVVEGEEVIVTAEAVTVRKDLTSSEARVTSESIENLPVQEIGDILSTQAGITTGDGGIHIRGGRSSEVAYFVDGIRVSDSYDGSVSVAIENDAIEELQVISGTFNAEYGQAMSGIINIVTKEGGERLRGSFEAFSGSYLPRSGPVGEDYILGTNVDESTEAGIQYADVRPYGFLEFEPTHYNNLQGSLGGPILTDRLTFYLFGRYFENEGWLYGANLFDIDGSQGDSSLVPMNPYKKLSGQANLKLRLSRDMSLSLIGMGSTSEDKGFYDHAWRWAPNGRPTNYDEGYNLNLKFTHTLNARIFYTVNIANYYSRFERYLFEDPFDSQYNDFLINPPPTVVTGSQRFLRGGTDLGRTWRTSNAYLARAEVTSQVHKNHLAKIGVEARTDHMELEGYGLLAAVDEQGQQITPFQPVIPDEGSSSYTSFDETPITLSAFIQDKMEFQDLIVNAGVRFDYFDSRSRIPADPEDPNIFNPFKLEHRFRDINGNGTIDPDEQSANNQLTVEDREEFWWQEADPKFQASPRLGVAYPITAQGVIHFSYGYFFQIPTFNRLFDDSGYKVTTQSQLSGPFGNPDLEAERTIMYEIGLQQGVGPLVLDITGFSRDVRNWVSTSAPIETRLPGVAYVVFSNRDYSNVRGVTFKASKRFTDHYAFDLNYTFQVAEGSNSNPDEEFFALRDNLQPTIALLPLNWDQRHTASANMFVGAAGWGISGIARYGSGYPYTPAFVQAETRGEDVSSNFPKNSRRRPPTFEIDLFAFKDIHIGPVRPRIYVQVYNLLDAGNPHSVFADTGEPDVTLEQQRVAAFDPGWFVRPDFYTEPRRIQLGIDFSF